MYAVICSRQWLRRDQQTLLSRTQFTPEKLTSRLRTTLTGKLSRKPKSLSSQRPKCTFQCRQSRIRTSVSFMMSTHMLQRLVIIRPHCSSTYVDVAYCYRWSNLVGLSVVINYFLRFIIITCCHCCQQLFDCLFTENLAIVPILPKVLILEL